MTTLQQVIRNPFARYLAPFLLFFALSSFQGLVNGPSLYWLYGAKMTLVFGVFIGLFKGKWHEIEGTFMDWRAVIVGIFVLSAWIFLCVNSAPRGEEPPFSGFLIKLTGSSIVVPLIEETVFRSFLMRYLIRSDFLAVPIGTYRHFSFVLTAIVFALAHPLWQWPAAMLAGLVYGIFLVRTKNLKGCILAHGITNLGLGIYVFLTGEWGLWV